MNLTGIVKLWAALTRQHPCPQHVFYTVFSLLLPKRALNNIFVCF